MYLREYVYIYMNFLSFLSTEIASTAFVFTYRQVSNISPSLIGKLNYWSHRCSGSITCRSSSNYIFILHLTLGFNILSKDYCKPRWETFKFWDLERLILEILLYIFCNILLMNMATLSTRYPPLFMLMALLAANPRTTRENWIALFSVVSIFIWNIMSQTWWTIIPYISCEFMYLVHFHFWCNTVAVAFAAIYMKTSWHGNTFHITGPLCRESTDCKESIKALCCWLALCALKPEFTIRYPAQRVSNWCFLCC